jgi:hypothetical protein
MKSSYGALQRIRKIILDKYLVNTGLDIPALVVCLHKKTPLIFECLGLNDKNTFYGCGDDVHASCLSNPTSQTTPIDRKQHEEKIDPIIGYPVYGSVRVLLSCFQNQAVF